MKYKVRASMMSSFLEGCGKVRNKMEWSDLSKMSDTHIRLAVELFNSLNGFETNRPTTLDMMAGIENEDEGIKMFDEHFGTDFYTGYKEGREVANVLGLKYDRENDFLTGTRDFGNDQKTYDAKGSTDKNVFDTKKFVDLEPNYVIQLNCYRLLYGTDELYLYNYLANATYGQIRKMVSNESYVYMLTDEMQDELQEKLERNYTYDHLPLSHKISVREVPIIENFAEIVEERVTVVNNWIEKNLE